MPEQDRYHSFSGSAYASQKSDIIKIFVDHSFQVSPAKARIDLNCDPQ